MRIGLKTRGVTIQHFRFVAPLVVGAKRLREGHEFDSPVVTYYLRCHYVAQLYFAVSRKVHSLGCMAQYGMVMRGWTTKLVVVCSTPHGNSYFHTKISLHMRGQITKLNIFLYTCVDEPKNRRNAPHFVNRYRYKLTHCLTPIIIDRW